VKPFSGIQLVQVQPGQSRSGQAGSECCRSPGDWRATKRTQRGSRLRGFSSEIAHRGDADAVDKAEGGIRTTAMRGCLEVAGV